MNRTVEFTVTDEQLQTIVDVYNNTNDDYVTVEDIQDYQICEVIDSLIDDQI